MSSGAHAEAPPETMAQMVPPQQATSVPTHWSPAAVQVGPGGIEMSGVQTRLPGVPAQLPPQQSPVAVHGAPSGAQRLWQESAPLPSGRQNDPQQAASTWHG